MGLGGLKKEFISQGVGGVDFDLFGRGGEAHDQTR